MGDKKHLIKTINQKTVLVLLRKQPKSI